MKNKYFHFLRTSLVLGVAAAALIGCGGNNKSSSGSSSEEPDDKDKTVIKVHNFEGGYGREWFDNVKAAFTEAVKDVSFEEGKKGVQIKYTGNKTVYKDDIVSAGYDLYFVEQGQYPYYVAQNYLEDITEVLTGENPYETSKTIESKLDDNQKAFYKSSDNKYYAVPHYTGSYGINYNVDLFDENNYYYKDGHPVVTSSSSFGDIFISGSSDKKAAGPDGIYDTDDDGLPVTFDEFYRLCDYITSDGNKALDWNTSTFDPYMTQMVAAQAASIDGDVNTLTSYAFTGTNSNLVKMNDNGTIALSGGKPQIESKAITEQYGYESLRTAGRYYATEFFRTLYNKIDWQCNQTKARSTGFTHLNAQQVFIESRDKANPIAMLFDGSWWQNEGAEYFPKSGEKTLAKSKFAVMPYPVPASSFTHHSTFLDALNALQFVRKGTKTEKPGTYAACVKFLQFMNSDDQLAKFTITTNTSRALKYTLSDEQINQLTYFGKKVYNAKNSSATENIYPVSNAKTFVNNQDTMIPCCYFKAAVTYTPSTGGGEKTQNFNYVTECYKGHENDISTNQIFEGMYRHYKTNWSNYYIQ